MLNYRCHDLRRVCLKVFKDLLRHDRVASGSNSVSRIIVERDVLFADLGQHIVDIEILLNVSCSRTWIIHIGVRTSKGIKKDVGGPQNLCFSSKMLDEVCILSRFEEVGVEVNGIFVRVERC